MLVRILFVDISNIF